jgi:hypothetical protein
MPTNITYCGKCMKQSHGGSCIPKEKSPLEPAREQEELQSLRRWGLERNLWIIRESLRRYQSGDRDILWTWRFTKEASGD